MNTELIEISHPCLQADAICIGLGRPTSQAIVQTAEGLARATVDAIGRELVWFNSVREVREAVEGIFAKHFERQLEDNLALCTYCGSVRVNYCERSGRTGVELDGCGEMTTASGYLCADCGAFEDGVITADVEVGR